MVSLVGNSPLKWFLSSAVALFCSEELQAKLYFEAKLLLPVLLSAWESEEALEYG